MEKDFTEWHRMKTKVQSLESKIYFNEREIWISFFGPNVGHEEDGKGEQFLRPVIIFRRINAETFWAIPLTSAEKIGTHYFSFTLQERKNVAIIAQIRILDRKRLWRMIAE